MPQVRWSDAVAGEGSSHTCPACAFRSTPWVGPDRPAGATYVALTEKLGAVLITCDAPLTNASGPRCAFDLIS